MTGRRSARRRPRLHLTAAALLAPFAVAAAQSPTPSPPPPPAPGVAALMGHFGSGLREVVAYEADGKLAVWADGRTLTLRWLAPRTFAVSGQPAWLGDTLRFLPDDGPARFLRAGDRVYVRRATGPAEGDVFRISPLRPVADVLRDARAAMPPAGAGGAHDLVDLTKAVPNLVLDVRYATANNFMGAALYPFPAAFARRTAAEALAAVQRELAAWGLGLVVYDAYRPWYVTRAFWDATPPAQRGFVADPSQGSVHNRGCAVDVGLYALQTGERIEMPSDYDEFTARAASDYVGGSERARFYRGVLRAAMLRNGFTANPTEWWHYDLRGWRAHPVLNVPFEVLAGRRPTGRR